MRCILTAALLAAVAFAIVAASSLKWDSRDPQTQYIQQMAIYEEERPQCPKNCTAWCSEKYNKSFGICNRSIGLCSCALP